MMEGLIATYLLRNVIPYLINEATTFFVLLGIPMLMVKVKFIIEIAFVSKVYRWFNLALNIREIVLTATCEAVIPLLTIFLNFLVNSSVVHASDNRHHSYWQEKETN